MKLLGMSAFYGKHTTGRIKSISKHKPWEILHVYPHIFFEFALYINFQIQYLNRGFMKIFLESLEFKCLPI